MLDEVHLYLKGGTQLQDLKSATNVEIPFSEIIRAEIYTKDKERTQASQFLGGFGITVVSVLIIGLVIALTITI